MRRFPLAGSRHEVLERLDHRVAPLAVHLPHLLDLALPVVLGEVRETAIWLNAGGHRVADSWASTSFSRTACGARASRRACRAKVFENDPR